MAYICSVGVSIPNYTIDQHEVKELVQKIFHYTEKQVVRLLPVFDNAEVHQRQFVVNKEWFEKDHSFEEKNALFQTLAIAHSLEAIDHCLTNQSFLTESIPYEAVDVIIFVTSSGIATPTIDAHLLNQRPFREDVKRFPLWGLGCAGGAMGLSRAFEWIQANPDKVALVVSCELVSLTFQKGDVKKSNIVGTALFGDGISAALLVGNESHYVSLRKKGAPKVIATSTMTKKQSTDVMGWNVTNTGLEVIFSKSIPSLVQSFWNAHVKQFFEEQHLDPNNIHSFIAHPGGKKVLVAMEEVLQCTSEKLDHSYNVLRNHGNMSSATVLHVLKEWMKEQIEAGEKSILSALGPGFSSEMLLLEWQ